MCDNLTEIIVDPDNPSYCSIDGVLYNKPATTIISCPDTKTYCEIPDSVSLISEEAFFNCHELSSIDIPCSIITIGRVTFFGCEKLESIVIPDSVTFIGIQGFNRCDNLRSIEIGSGVSDVSQIAFSACPSLTEIRVSEDNAWFSSDDVGVLYNKDKTVLIKCPSGTAETSFIIPNTVEKLEQDAFSECRQLSSVTLNNNLKVIEGSSFFRCSNLISMTIPNGVERIGSNAFGECHNLTTVSIPESVISIVGDAFTSCGKLTSILVDTENKNYSNDEFGCLYNKDKTELIHYPVGRSEKEFIVPNGVTVIGSDAFFHSRHLSRILLPSTLSELSSSAFYGCNCIQTMIIPNGVATINSFTFELCSGLQSLVIPTSVTKIDNYGFRYCTELADVYYYGSEEDWNRITIGTNNECLLNATIHFNHVHSIKEPTIIKNATCTEDGLQQGFCVCEFEMEETIKAAGTHSPGEIVVENVVFPTCLKSGNYENVVYCEKCGTTISREKITTDALGHIDENSDGLCDRCNTRIQPEQNQNSNNAFLRFFQRIGDFFRSIFDWFNRLF